MANRRDLLKMASMTPMALLAAANPQLASAVYLPETGKLTHETFGDLCVYCEGPTGQLKSMTAGSLRLKPGMSPHPPHRHEEEEFMVIAEGSGEITVEGKITKVGPGAMMYAAANQLHGIVNTGRVLPLLFYYYKWKA